MVLQYDFDPYGNRTTLSGSMTFDIGFAGYLHHDASGLDFALYRAYDTEHGRWLNRDPIGEAGGLNLYAYVGDDPTSSYDPSGLAPPGRTQPSEPGVGWPWDFPLDPRPWSHDAAQAAQDAVENAAAAVENAAAAVSKALEESRSIPKPRKPSCGCTCTCRADANDNIPGNITCQTAQAH